VSVSAKSGPRNQLNHNSCSPDVPAARRGWRAEARFVRDWREVCRPLDRNGKARVHYLARALDRRTKAAGARRGLLGDTALEVLRVLLYVFHNAASGRCDPSYEALQRETRYCRQTISHALARLERAGIVRITRRLCRQWVTRVSPITGCTEHYVGTTQTTSLYSMGEPPAWAEHLPVPAGRRAPFPPGRQLSLLEQRVA
jgi:hypothetical protein